MAKKEPVSKTDLSQLKTAVAVLATCIAQTANESDRTFSSRLVSRLDRAYATVRNDKTYDLQVLELLSSVRILITGFSVGTGEIPTFLGEPFNRE
jgi:hypothetical protein